MSAPVEPDRARKSVGAEDTFVTDIFELPAAGAELRPLVAKIWGHCEAKGLHARTVTLKVKFAGFQQITRSRTLGVPPATVDEVEVH
jgi:DNA polymerase IV